MGRAWHDRQLFFRFEFFISLSIEIDRDFIERANDKEGRRQYSWERRHREIGPAAAGHHRADCRSQGGPQR